MDQLLAYLHSIYPLSDALRDHLLKIIRIKEIPKRGYLLKQGQINREIHFIRTGLLRCYYLKNGIEVSSWFMTAGDTVVSIESFYDQKEGYEFIQALEDTELFYISFDELENIYKKYVEFNFIGRVLTTRYLKMWNTQLFNIRMQTARERYHFLLKNHPEVIQRVPSKFVASYLAMDEATFCKMKKVK
jgi:CRP-like cAMP-binding protein